MIKYFLRLFKDPKDWVFAGTIEKYREITFKIEYDLIYVRYGIRISIPKRTLRRRFIYVVNLERLTLNLVVIIIFNRVIYVERLGHTGFKIPAVALKNVCIGRGTKLASRY